MRRALAACSRSGFWARTGGLGGERRLRVAAAEHAQTRAAGSGAQRPAAPPGGAPSARASLTTSCCFGLSCQRHVNSGLPVVGSGELFSSSSSRRRYYTPKFAKKAGQTNKLQFGERFHALYGRKIGAKSALSRPKRQLDSKRARMSRQSLLDSPAWTSLAPDGEIASGRA